MLGHALIAHVREDFERHMGEHELTILRDDGVYRHLRCMAPDTWMYGFDVVTWPGYLFVGGDFDDYVFARTEDMFGWFWGSGGEADRINPHYWSQKLQGPRRGDTAERYDPDNFRSRILEWARESLAEWDADAAEAQADGWCDEHLAVYPDLLLGALEKEVLREDWLQRLPEDEREAHERLWDYQWLFGETYEWSFREYDRWFLWACFAVVWAIKRYREVKETP